MSAQRMKIVATISGLLIGILTNTSRAQQAETDSARSERHTKTESSLAKAAQNPVANMVSLPFQYNYYSGGGLDSASEMVLNVQPVLPLPIGKSWLIVARTIVPFVSVPLPNDRQVGGIADIQEQAYLTSTKPSMFTWGAGPVFSFPTATNPVARTGQWGLGPTVVGLVMPGPWVIGALVNNIWRIGGTDHGHVLNSFTLQPFINYNLARAWAISTAPLITSDWSAPEGERWTVPIGAGVSKITHIGEQPMEFVMQYYHNVKHPSLSGSNQIRLQVVALWPTAAAEAARKKEEEVAKQHQGSGKASEKQ